MEEEHREETPEATGTLKKIPTGNTEDEGPIANFWYRIMAYVIDVLILRAAGMIPGLAAGIFLGSLGLRARLLGFGLATLYFGFLSSYRGGGQTLGQRILGIRVVGMDGRGVSLPIAFGRAVFLSASYLAVQPALVPLPAMSYRLLLYLATTAVEIGLVYFYLVNRKTRQSLHDLIFRTYVVRVDVVEPVRPALIPWYHYAGYGLILYLSLALVTQVGGFATRRLGRTVDLPSRLATVAALERNPSIVMASLTEGVKKSRGGQDKYLRVVVRWRGDPAVPEAAAREVAGITAANFADFGSKDYVDIRIESGFDIGIASYTKTFENRATPAEWQQRLKPEEP